MTVEGVVAEVGLAADEPAGERRPRIIKHFAEWPLPVDELRFLSPETFAIGDRVAVEVPVSRHRSSLVWIDLAMRRSLARTSAAASPSRSASAASRICSARSISPGSPGLAWGGGGAFSAVCSL